MKLCDTCIYRNNVEQLKPCIIYRDDCEFYKKEREDMTREEAIKIIKECKEKGFKHTFYTLNQYHEAIDIAIKSLEQNESAEEWYKLFVEKLKQEPEWIPVSKRMPDIHNLTNGDALKTLFPYHSLIFNYDEEYILFVIENSMCCKFTLNWWNAPYKAESEEI